MSAEKEPLTAEANVMQTWLTHMYPGLPGYLSVCSDADGWSGRRFTTDTAGLNAALQYGLALDQRKPKGIYLQVTTLRDKPDTGRGGEDLAHAVPYIWADGDYGTIGHKPGPDDLPAPPDFDAVMKVVAESGMPDPTGWSNSGGGGNPGWSLDELLVITDDNRAHVEELVNNVQLILGASAYRLGWSWDTGIGNLDRLMRWPGTINRKEGLERPTFIGPSTGTVYSLDELAQTTARLAVVARTTLEQAGAEKHERRRARLGHPVPGPRRTKTTRFAAPSGDGPLDVIADAFQFNDLLQPAGFSYEGTHRDGREMWLRPAASGDRASSPYSLLCDDHVAVNWSDRADLPVGAQPSGSKLTIGTLYAHLNYGGDVAEAARDILRAAAGRTTSGPAAQLSEAILEEVRRRCGVLAVVRQPATSDIDWGDLATPAETGPGDSEDLGRGGEIKGLLPEEFYAQREELRQIRQAGHHWTRSGDVAFLAVLTRLSAMVSHHIRADTGVAGYASLNLFGALVGPSGIGKSTGVDVAQLLLPVPEHLDFRDNLPIGSGEGIAEVFIDIVEEETGEIRKGRGGTDTPVTHRVRRQVRHNAFFYVDEGATLTRLMKERSGSTLGETLRSAAVGQTLGQTNASKDTTRYIPKGSYSMGMLVGFQPETAEALFDEVAEGTPQRFLWLQVIDPSIPDERPEWPGELLKWRDVVSANSLTLVSFDEQIKTELRRADLAKARGEVSVANLNPLDSHAPLMRVKVASLLAILTGRRHVTVDDWELADMVWAASCATRDALLADIARRRTVESEKRTEARIIEEVRVDQAKATAEAQRADKAVLRIAARIAALVQDSGPMTRSALRTKFASRDKKHLNDAYAYAVLREWVEEKEGRFVPGPVAPG
ncbi:hypothetical protein AB0407_22570 [Streptomyces microflavus]|uniref:hypothetical protein n=1 Tax=Streptomyces microflavus TaxID=1919 RepID=UPI00344D6920